MKHCSLRYGLDAPHIILGLLSTGCVLIALVLSADWGVGITQQLIHWYGYIVPFISGRTALLAASISCIVTALLMLASSTCGKIRQREKLLNLIPWRGDEQVLDVGCGRGLLLIGAAHRLTTGMATGIDLWHAKDQSGNTPQATRNNANHESVSKRVQVKNGDARSMPFPDASFDVILSSFVVHNLTSVSDRRAAVEEMLRVCEPGGHIILQDFLYIKDYAAWLRTAGQAVAISPLQWQLFPPARYIVCHKKPQ